jgi:hypothetical protein
MSHLQQYTKIIIDKEENLYDNEHSPSCAYCENAY